MARKFSAEWKNMRKFAVKMYHLSYRNTAITWDGCGVNQRTVQLVQEKSTMWKVGVVVEEEGTVEMKHYVNVKMLAAVIGNGERRKKTQ